MCGIFGSINIDQENFEKSALDSLHHRGPDDRGYIKDNNVIIGMTRLSIIDLETGSQPISNQKGDIHLVCNGEIYNFIELKEELKEKVNFKTNSDVECILKLYELYSFDFIHKLRGMFSFAIYDASKSIIFIARDRLGIKPLYYSYYKNKFIFSSEIKTILECNSIKASPNIKKMFPHNYFFMNLETHVNEIMEQEPGTYSVVNITKNDINKKTFKYWSTSLIENNDNENNVIYNLEKKLDEATQIHLRSDVPVGLMLSGGVDSNIVGYFGKKNYTRKFNSFTFGNKEKGLNEFEATDLTSKKVFNSIQKNVYLNFDDIFTTIPKVMRSLEVSEPRIFESSLATYLLMKEVKKYNKVILCGEGADELFGGYPGFFKDKSKVQLIDEYKRHYFGGLYRLQLKRLDKITMAHSIEARVPFLDHIFFEYASSININLRNKSGILKYILRKMSEKFLPNEIAWRPKEQFTVGTGLSNYITDWISGISDKALNSLPLRDLSEPKEKIWNQSHSNENFMKYNKIVANLFYFTFIDRKQINSVEDIFKF